MLVSTVGLCIIVACPVDPMVDNCPVIEPVRDHIFWVVDSVVWVVDPVVRVGVLIRLHSCNVIVVFT